MPPLVERIRTELMHHADVNFVERQQSFHKDSIQSLGVRTPVVRGIAKQLYDEVQGNGFAALLDNCEMLLEQRVAEFNTIAFDWAYRAKKSFQLNHFSRFEKWLAKYVQDWASCDDFCTHAFGEFLRKFPECWPDIEKWVSSPNRWFRRGAAVILIYPNRHADFLAQAFFVTNSLLLDPDDLVQKGYGWLLKELSKKHPQQIYDYVLSKKSTMPRTALRYACEKMPKEWQTQLMAK